MDDFRSRRQTASVLTRRRLTIAGFPLSINSFSSGGRDKGAGTTNAKVTPLQLTQLKLRAVVKFVEIDQIQ
jgi:hypothetical protein